MEPETAFPAIEALFSKDSALIMLCPVCQHAYSYHTEVVIFDRREDGETELSYFGETPPFSDNPSPRRSAISIAIVGECEHSWRLNIIQHKGNTFLTVVS